MRLNISRSTCQSEVFQSYMQEEERKTESFSFLKCEKKRREKKMCRYVAR
jgi:hypothetical protein